MSALRSATLKAKHRPRGKVKIIQSRYIPTAKQALFHRCNADNLLFGGAAGPGKTRGVVEDAVAFSMHFDRVVSYIFRRTYPELEDNLIPEAMATIDPLLGRYHGGSHTYIFHNKSEIRFRSCQHRKDVFKFQGAEMHRIYLDEMGHFFEDMVNYLRTRVRVPKWLAQLGVRPKQKGSANPGGPGHAFLKKTYIDPAPGYWQTGGEWSKVVYSKILNKSKQVRYAFIPAKATDNKHLTDDYMFQLEEKPKKLREALLYGNWDVFEGQVFIEFENVESQYYSGQYTHVIAPFTPPPSWTRYRSFDYGYSKPFSVGWWAVDEDGRAYRYKEWYGANKDGSGLKLTVEEIAKGIKEREQKERELGLRIRGIADPAIWDGSGGTGESIAQQFLKQNVRFTPANNARISGKQQIHNRLAFDDDGRPMLYVCSNCKDFIRTVPSLNYSLIDPEDVDTTAEDHTYDETRYFCMAVQIKAPPNVKHPIKIPPLNPLEEKKIIQGDILTLGDY